MNKLEQYWTRLKNWAVKIWKQMDNWPTFFLFLFICALLYLPVWGGWLVYKLFHLHWGLYIAGLAAAFWAGPFTPFFGYAVALTLAIKEWYLHTFHH